MVEYSMLFIRELHFAVFNQLHEDCRSSQHCGGSSNDNGRILPYTCGKPASWQQPPAQTITVHTVYIISYWWVVCWTLPEAKMTISNIVRTVYGSLSTQIFTSERRRVYPKSIKQAGLMFNRFTKERISGTNLISEKLWGWISDVYFKPRLSSLHLE